MRIILFAFFMLISAKIFSQAPKFVDTTTHKTDSVKKPIKIDSAYYYADTTRIPIPASLMPAFMALSRGDDEGLTLGQYKRIIAIEEQWTNKQLVKKPKK